MMEAQPMGMVVLVLTGRPDHPAAAWWAPGVLSEGRLTDGMRELTVLGVSDRVHQGCANPINGEPGPLFLRMAG